MKCIVLSLALMFSPSSPIDAAPVAESDSLNAIYSLIFKSHALLFYDNLFKKDASSKVSPGISFTSDDTTYTLDVSLPTGDTPGSFVIVWIPPVSGVICQNAFEFSWREGGSLGTLVLYRDICDNSPTVKAVYGMDAVEQAAEIMCPLESVLKLRHQCSARGR